MRRYCQLAVAIGVAPLFLALTEAETKTGLSASLRTRLGTGARLRKR